MTYAFTHLRGTLEEGAFECSYSAYVQIERSGGEVPTYRIYEVESVSARVEVHDPETNACMGSYNVEATPFAAQRYWLLAIHRALDSNLEQIDLGSLNFIPPS